MQSRKLAKEFLSWAITRLTAACSWVVNVCAAGTGGTLIGGYAGGATVVVEVAADVVAGLVVVVDVWVVGLVVVVVVVVVVGMVLAGCVIVVG
jgi:hypothetical protein